MPRKTKNVRGLYAQIPADLYKRVEKAADAERRDKREIVIQALTNYVTAPAAEVPTVPAPAVPVENVGA